MSVLPLRQPEDYDTLMLNCLKSCNFNRKQAIKLFLAQFPASVYNWLNSYSYKVYHRVVGKLPPQELMDVFRNNYYVMVNAAAEEAFDHAMATKDFTAFSDIARLMNNHLLEMGKQVGPTQQTNVQINDYGNLMNDISRLEQKFRVGGAAPGGYGVPPVPALDGEGIEAQPIINLPS